MWKVVNHNCQYFPLFAIISRYFPVNATGMANMLICRHFANLAPKATDCPAVEALKTHVSEDLKRRYKLNDPSILCKSLAMVCTFLDPQIKGPALYSHKSTHCCSRECALC